MPAAMEKLEVGSPINHTPENVVERGGGATTTKTTARTHSVAERVHFQGDLGLVRLTATLSTEADAHSSCASHGTQRDLPSTSSSSNRGRLCHSPGAIFRHHHVLSTFKGCQPVRYTNVSGVLTKKRHSAMPDNGPYSNEMRGRALACSQKERIQLR
jgi:hypothetical protein